MMATSIDFGLLAYRSGGDAGGYEYLVKSSGFREADFRGFELETRRFGAEAANRDSIWVATNDAGVIRATVSWPTGRDWKGRPVCSSALVIFQSGEDVGNELSHIWSELEGEKVRRLAHTPTVRVKRPQVRSCITSRFVAIGDGADEDELRLVMGRIVAGLCVGAKVVVIICTRLVDVADPFEFVTFADLTQWYDAVCGPSGGQSSAGGNQSANVDGIRLDPSASYSRSRTEQFLEAAASPHQHVTGSYDIPEPLAEVATTPEGLAEYVDVARAEPITVEAVGLEPSAGVTVQAAPAEVSSAEITFAEVAAGEVAATEATPAWIAPSISVEAAAEAAAAEVVPSPHGLSSPNLQTSDSDDLVGDSRPYTFVPDRVTNSDAQVADGSMTLQIDSVNPPSHTSRQKLLKEYLRLYRLDLNRALRGRRQSASDRIASERIYDVNERLSREVCNDDEVARMFRAWLRYHVSRSEDLNLDAVRELLLPITATESLSSFDGLIAFIHWSLPIASKAGREYRELLQTFAMIVASERVRSYLQKALFSK